MQRRALIQLGLAGMLAPFVRIPRAQAQEDLRADLSYTDSENTPTPALDVLKDKNLQTGITYEA
jgi:hypothetical protein